MKWRCDFDNRWFEREDGTRLKFEEVQKYAPVMQKISSELTEADLDEITKKVKAQYAYC